MKPALPILISLFLLSSLSTSHLYANTECNTGNEITEDNYCYSPEWHNTYNISYNSASFQWETVYGANYYTIEWRYQGGSWHSLPGYCYNNWITVYNLQSCTGYEWRVRSHCDYNNYSNWCYPVYFSTQCNSCHPPQWLDCYNITGTSATWKWDEVYGAEYYKVQWRYQGGSWSDLSGGPFYGTWVNVHHLNPCTYYEWRVMSYCHGSWSNWCYPHTFTTTCHSSCQVPSGLMTKDIGDTKATFKWFPVHGAYNYSLQIRDHYGNWYDVPGSPTGGIWITVYNLVPCKTYQWRIKSNCGNSSYGHSGSSNWSQPQYFTTTCGHGCYAPEWVFTNGVTSSSALLHWGSVIGASGYVIEWRASGGQWNMLSGSWPNNVAELNGLQTNTYYEWRVRAICDGLYGNWSPVTHFTTSGATCGMPLFRYTTPVTDSTATFNWSAVSGAISYTVQFRLFNGTWSDVPGSPTSGTSITATGLLPNTMYEWRMQVNCVNGHGIWLSPIMFITGSSNGCGTPGSLFADSISLTSALLTWGEVSEALTYSVEMRQFPHGPWAPVFGSPVDTNFIFVDSLDPHTTYEWRVRANCQNGLHSFYSGVSHFNTTDLPPCHAPDSLRTDSITATSAIFQWDSVAGVVGYEVQIRLPNGIWVDAGGFITDTFLLATGLTPNTTYEWRVRTKCNDLQFSNWSVSVFMTTGNADIMNDDCGTATLLTVSSECVPTFATNVDATASNPAPMGGCSSMGYRDVWFRFNMPDNPNPGVTIRTVAGSLANAVMEVYSGSDCNFLSVIACEDNNDNGNGSSMPVINLTGTPNATIWVRVWGFEGSTGTFTICVFDDISFDRVVPQVTPVADEIPNVVEGQKADPDVINISSTQLQISPNPASDILRVNVLQTEECTVAGIRILDLSGKIVFTQKYETINHDDFNSSVDVSGLLPGIYLIQVQTNCGLMTEKISVMR